MLSIKILVFKYGQDEEKIYYLSKKKPD